MSESPTRPPQDKIIKLTFNIKEIFIGSAPITLEEQEKSVFSFKKWQIKKVRRYPCSLFFYRTHQTLDENKLEQLIQEINDL